MSFCPPLLALLTATLLALPAIAGPDDEERKPGCADHLVVYPLEIDAHETLVVDPRGFERPSEAVERKLRELAERTGFAMPATWRLRIRPRP